LAGRVIASHYAEQVDLSVASTTELRLSAQEDAEVIGKLAPGEPFSLLDDSLGWAWGYAGKERRVGYVPTKALADHCSTEVCSQIKS
jgi:hypothetical protein